ncbi:unnamed protein product, partial [marine sediment metagenome]
RTKLVQFCLGITKQDNKEKFNILWKKWIH